MVIRENREKLNKFLDDGDEQIENFCQAQILEARVMPQEEEFSEVVVNKNTEADDLDKIFQENDNKKTEKVVAKKASVKPKKFAIDK